MTRRFVLLAAFAGLACLAPLARGADDDDEPTFAGKKLSYWMTQLTDGKDAKDRQRGLIGVEQIGHYGSRKVVPALVKAMRDDKDEKVRARAARSVGRAIAKAMQQARDDKKDELPRFDNARDELIIVLRTDKIDAVREAAAAALGDVGSDARGSASALALALKDKHDGTVVAAAVALRRMGRDAKEAESELTALLGDAKANPDARSEAAVTLGQIRADVSSALPTMRSVLTDPKIEAPKDADEKAKLAARDKALRLRRAVAEALGKWGKESADAAPTLAVVLIDKNSPTELRLAAVTAIEQIGVDGKAAVPALVKAVDDGDRFVRCLAMQTLAKMGEVLEDSRKPAVKAILKATEADVLEVCVAAVETLGALSVSGGLSDFKADVLKRLDEIEKREGRKPLREAAAAARAKIDPKKKVKDKDKEK
jgi:HEAT repeat protein